MRKLHPNNSWSSAKHRLIHRNEWKCSWSYFDSSQWRQNAACIFGLETNPLIRAPSCPESSSTSVVTWFETIIGMLYLDATFLRSTFIASMVSGSNNRTIKHFGVQVPRYTKKSPGLETSECRSSACFTNSRITTGLLSWWRIMFMGTLYNEKQQKNFP